MLLATSLLCAFAPPPAVSNSLVTNSSIANSSSGLNLESCACPTPSAAFGNEIIAIGQNGQTCVGTGSCAGPFEMHRDGGMVHSISFWYGGQDGGFAGITVRFFDDAPGSTPAHTGRTNQGTPTTCTFAPGEYIVGDIIMESIDWTKRAGYIKFTTSAKQTCEAGVAHEAQQIFPSGNAFLAGVFGTSGLDINQLGLFVWKPIKSTTLESISYPTIDSLARVQTPVQIASHTYCNDNDAERTYETFTESHKVTTGQDACFTSTTSFQYGQSVSVEASVPELGKVKSEMHWQLSETVEFKNCEQHTVEDEKTITFPTVTMAPHTRTQFVFSQWQGALAALPYEATVRITFTDSTSYVRALSGEYEGATTGCKGPSSGRDSVGARPPCLLA